MKPSSALARRTLLSALAAVGMWTNAVAAAEPMGGEGVRDCPLAHVRYSLDTPLIDLMIDARSRELVDKSAVLAGLPAAIRDTNTPSFAAILSLRTVQSLARTAPGTMATLDRSLKALPIRPRDVVLRCARYERDARRPLPVKPGRRAVLVFEKSNGFRDGPSVDAATAALRRIGERRGWQMVFTSRSGDFTAANLRQFDAVAWNNVSGDALTLAQRRAFRRYIEGGGGFAGFHGSGGDPAYWWDWYADTLLGARFIGHASQHQEARLVLEGQGGLAPRVPPGWVLKDEWYSFARSPRESGAHVMVTLDERSYDPRDGQRDIRMGDHPIAWTRCVGHGRSFYSAIGHRPEVYSDDRNQTLMEEGIAWAMGLSDSRCRAGHEVPAHKA